MSNHKQLVVAALAANAALLSALLGEEGTAAASAGTTEAPATGTRGRGRPAAAASTPAETKLTNDEVAAVVTKVKDHPNGGLPTAKALIAEVGAKKIADIKDQATLKKLRDAAEAKLAELEGDGQDEEL